MGVGAGRYGGAGGRPGAGCACRDPAAGGRGAGLAGAAGLLAALSEPNMSAGYASFERAVGYWTVPSAAAAASVLAQTPAGARGGTSVWSTGPAGGRGAEWTLPLNDGWLGPRLLAVGAIAEHAAGSRWLLVGTAVVVWTPRRLELPSGVASVSVRALSGGPPLADVSAPASVARIVAAVNGLDVDDAVHAIYACPAEPVGQRPRVRPDLRRRVGGNARDRIHRGLSRWICCSRCRATAASG